MNDTSVVCRFAPSPTGFLHIGGARTALFNWLYARHHGGQFLLRIEDTDRARSTEAAIEAIFKGLKWLELDWDEAPVFQSRRAERHAEVVDRLLRDGKAYKCFCTPEELAAMREAARKEGRQPRYDGRWRERDPAEAPPGVSPAIRIKAPQTGETVIADLVQGEVRIANEQLDDMVVLRADGTPTYMLSVVVDDHDMAISHIIRGDDHLTNAARQSVIYQALGWPTPAFAHIPLIHGPDGAKLSKRHGALGVEAYEAMGYLPAAMRNYLLRLGWAHGDDEIISTAEAIEWFGLDGVGKSPARFDQAKLDSLNGHYIRETADDELTRLAEPHLQETKGAPLTDVERERLALAMPGLKARAKTLVELAALARYLVAVRPIRPDDKAARHLDAEGRARLAALRPRLTALVDDWRAERLEAEVRAFADEIGVGLGKIAQPLRASLTGSTISPGIFDVLASLGADESLARIADAAE